MTTTVNLDNKLNAIKEDSKTKKENFKAIVNQSNTETTSDLMTTKLLDDVKIDQIVNKVCDQFEQQPISIMLHESTSKMFMITFDIEGSILDSCRLTVTVAKFSRGKEEIINQLAIIDLNKQEVTKKIAKAQIHELLNKSLTVHTDKDDYQVSFNNNLELLDFCCKSVMKLINKGLIKYIDQQHIIVLSLLSLKAEDLQNDSIYYSTILYGIEYIPQPSTKVKILKKVATAKLDAIEEKTDKLIDTISEDNDGLEDLEDSMEVVGV